ncbi:hypothetical protein [Pseudonocardia acaciae]|uniref:hypothetical protein n=1 Tax=Pseudonocardia acaciae TaxID=551276 RepID=UPI00048AA97C|nr:hypothetical protein [Pseudonocardia acaciae]
MQPTELNASAASALATAPAVLELAESSRWRAPEVTAALAEQAVQLARAGGDRASALRAEGWLAHGLVTIGRGVAAVPRAAQALSEAGRGNDAEAAGRLRVELASVARTLGDRDTALALLAPVLGHVEVSLGLRADAHLEAARCGGAESPDGALESVGVAAGALRQLGGEYAELGLAAVDAVLARQQRERGQVNGAMERAREGLRRVLGGASGDGALDPVSPYLAAELSLELTLALLDGGQTEAVRDVARSVLRWGARPGALVPVSRMRLTLAQRVYLPAGEEDAALAAAEWVSKVIESHDLPEVEVECHGLLAEIRERRGELPFALTASRRAHQAYRLHAARVEQALVLLARAGSETRLASAQHHPADTRADGQAALSTTQTHIFDGRAGELGAAVPRPPRPTEPGQPGGGVGPGGTRERPESVGPAGSRSPDALDSETQPSRPPSAPPPSGTGSSWSARPAGPGQPPVRPFGAPEPSGRAGAAGPRPSGPPAPPVQRPPGAEPRRGERAEPTGGMAPPRQDAVEYGRPPADMGQGHRAPRWPERGPRQEPSEPSTGPRPANPVSVPTFDMPRVAGPVASGPADGPGRPVDAPGGLGSDGPGRGSPMAGAVGSRGIEVPGRAPERRGPHSSDAFDGPVPGRHRPGADPGAAPDAPGSGRGWPGPSNQAGPGVDGLGQPREPDRRGGADRRLPGDRLTGRGDDRELGTGGRAHRSEGRRSGDRPREGGQLGDGGPGGDRLGDGGRFGGRGEGRRSAEGPRGRGFGGGQDDRGPFDDGPGGGRRRADAGRGVEATGGAGRPAWGGAGGGAMASGRRRAPEPVQAPALSVPELAVKLAELADETGQPPHLVLVDIVAPDGSPTGPSVTALAGRIGERVRGQIPPGARVYRLDQDAMAIGMPETDPEVVTRWVRALSTGLSQAWPELAADVPRAVFRIGVRWLGGALSVEQHVRELRSGRVGAPSGAPDQPTYPTDQPSFPPYRVPGQAVSNSDTGLRSDIDEPPAEGDDGPAAGRHGAPHVEPEPSRAFVGANRVSAPPGSGGRRRRGEGGAGDTGGYDVRRSSAPFGSVPDLAGAPGRSRSRATTAPTSARWEVPANGGGSVANGSPVNGTATNGHLAPVNGHAALGGVEGTAGVRGLVGEGVAAGSVAGTGAIGRTALAEPEPPARRRRRRDALAASGEAEADEPELNGGRPLNGTHSVNGVNGAHDVNGGRRVNGHHREPEVAASGNGHRFGDRDGQEDAGHDGSRRAGRHARPSVRGADGVGVGTDGAAAGTGVNGVANGADVNGGVDGLGADGLVNGSGAHGSVNGVNGSGAHRSADGVGVDGLANGVGAHGSVNGSGAGGVVNGVGAHGSVDGFGSNGSVNGSGADGLANGASAHGSINGSGSGGLANGAGMDGAVNGAGGSDRPGDADGPDGEDAAGDRPGGRAARAGGARSGEQGPLAGRAVSELSFAELLAGALAAYREA